MICTCTGKNRNAATGMCTHAFWCACIGWLVHVYGQVHHLYECPRCRNAYLIYNIYTKCVDKQNHSLWVCVGVYIYCIYFHIIHSPCLTRLNSKHQAWEHCNHHLSIYVRNDVCIRTMLNTVMLRIYIYNCIYTCNDTWALSKLYTLSWNGHSSPKRNTLAKFSRTPVFFSGRCVTHFLVRGCLWEGMKLHGKWN